MERIDSPHNPWLMSLRKEADGKGELFLAEGRHMAEEAIRHEKAEAILSLSPYPSPVRNVILSEKAFRSLADQKTPEGVIALCHKGERKPLSSSRLLVLDGVQDPGNAGTLMRTALAFSFHDVVFLKGSVRPYGRKALQASQGAIFALNVVESSENKEDFFSLLERSNYKIITTSLQGEEKEDLSFPEEGKLALVLGSEGQGVGKEALAHASLLLRIPIEGIDSLNVAVAGGILMHALRPRKG